MQNRLTARLESLREEYRAGQNMLADLEAKELDVRQTLLRISGAIQVLEELLMADRPSAANGSTPAGSAIASDELATPQSTV